MICLSDYTKKDHELCTLTCGHVFGKCCIQPLERCPMCKKKFKKTEIIQIYASDFSTITYEEIYNLMIKYKEQKEHLENSNFLNKLLIHQIREIPEDDNYITNFLEKRVIIKKEYELEEIYDVCGNNGHLIISGFQESTNEYILKYVDLENYERMGKTCDFFSVIRSNEKILLRGITNIRLFAHLAIGNKFVDLCLMRIQLDFVYEHTSTIIISSQTTERVSLGTFLDANNNIYFVPDSRFHLKTLVIFSTDSDEDEEIRKNIKITKIITPKNMTSYFISENKIYGIFNSQAFLKLEIESNIINFDIKLNQTILLYRINFKVVIKMIGEINNEIQTNLICNDCIDIILLSGYLLIADNNELYKFSYLGNIEKFEKFDSLIKKICEIETGIGVFTEKYFYFLK